MSMFESSVAKNGHSRHISRAVEAARILGEPVVHRGGRSRTSRAASGGTAPTRRPRDCAQVLDRRVSCASRRLPMLSSAISLITVDSQK